MDWILDWIIFIASALAIILVVILIFLSRGGASRCNYWKVLAESKDADLKLYTGLVKEHVFGYGHICEYSPHITKLLDHSFFDWPEKITMIFCYKGRLDIWDIPLEKWRLPLQEAIGKPVLVFQQSTVYWPEGKFYLLEVTIELITKPI